MQFQVPSTCCEPSTCPPLTEAGPIGPQGNPGNDGTSGTDGVNAFTALTDQFTMPAVDATAVAEVGSTAWMAVGQYVFLENAGYLIVDNIVSSTEVELENDGATGNVVAGSIIGVGNSITPAGPPGQDGSLTGSAGGSLAGTYPDPTLSLTGVAAGTYTKVTVTTEGRISSGTTLSDTDIPNLPASKITTGTLAVANGGTGQATATDAFDALSPLTTKGDIIVNNGTNDVRKAVGSNGNLVQAASAITEGIRYSRGSILLGTASCDANTTGDTAIPIIAASYIVRKIVAYNASISLTTVAGGIYTAAAKGGSVLVAATQVYSALTASTKFLDLTLQAPATTDVQSSANLYFSPTTPQGAAATVTVEVWGDQIT